MDTINAIQCPDCNTAVPIAFGIVLVQRGTARIAMMSVCPYCVKREGKITLRGYITLPRRELVEACNRGLPALEVK